MTGTVALPRTRTSRDIRRRSLGQNFLISQKAILTLLEHVRPKPGDLIVELAAGRGALTIPLARRGARVIAVEKDPVWVRHLEQAIADAGVEHRVTITHTDLRSVALPSDTYRVVASPPFNLTTAVLSRLLDDPADGPWRADLLLQYEVARKRAALVPSNLKSAAWSPWWTFELGPFVPRSAYRPVPSVDASLLTVRRRNPPILPEWLAPAMREALRPHWNPPIADPLRGSIPVCDGTLNGAFG